MQQSAEIKSRIGLSTRSFAPNNVTNVPPLIQTKNSSGIPTMAQVASLQVTNVLKPKELTKVSRKQHNNLGTHKSFPNPVKSMEEPKRRIIFSKKKGSPCK